MQHFVRKVDIGGKKTTPVFTWELLLLFCMWLSYLLAGILVCLPFCAGLFLPPASLPRLAEISSFVLSWPSTHECWAEGMSAGCPAGVQTCTEASGEYCPAWLESCSTVGFMGQVKSWVRERKKKKKSPKYNEHRSTVMQLKWLSRLFCAVSLFDLPFLSCLLVWWVTLSVPQNKIWTTK